MLVNLISSIVVFIVSMGINFFLTPHILKSLGNEAYGFVGLSNAIVAYALVVTAAITMLPYMWPTGPRRAFLRGKRCLGRAPSRTNALC